MTQESIKAFIRFAYTSQITASGQKTINCEEALDLLRTAVYFHDSRLQEALAALEIIPNMNTTSATTFMKELSEWSSISPCQREPSKRVKAFILDYCMFYLTKNLPVILRQDRRRLIQLPQEYIWELVRMCFNYLVDAKADIEIVLQFAAETFANEKSIFGLFNMVNERVQTCCGFDSQAIAKISDLKRLEPNV